jgi:hypothetical protein
LYASFGWMDGDKEEDQLPPGPGRSVPS